MKPLYQRKFDFGEKTSWKKGDHVEYHPALDCWARGAKDGYITHINRNRIYTRSWCRRVRTSIPNSPQGWSYIRPFM